MDRRKFLRRVAVAGTGAVGVAAGATAIRPSSQPEPRETAKVTWDVKGYTCVTCAVGLEVMLRREKGVMRADASWPDRNVAIGFDETLTSEKELREFIAGCGFSVA